MLKLIITKEERSTQTFGAWRIEENRVFQPYLMIQKTESGWKYYIYKHDLTLNDCGVISDSKLSLAEVRNKVLCENIDFSHIDGSGDFGSGVSTAEVEFDKFDGVLHITPIDQFAVQDSPEI